MKANQQFVDLIEAVAAEAEATELKKDDQGYQLRSYKQERLEMIVESLQLLFQQYIK